ncbi:MAG: hypothetical protein Q9164_006704, partial [Protoblastenia rupestris]
TLLKEIIFERLMPLIESHAEEKRSLDMRDVNDAAAVDLITGFIFGSLVGTNLLQNIGARRAFLDHHCRERSYGFWQQELPFVTALFRRLGISLRSRSAADSARWLERWFVHTCQLVNRTNAANRPATKAILHEHLSQMMLGPPQQAHNADPNLTLVSELHDHCVAGFETTGLMLTSAMQALSRRPDIQSRLRLELSLLNPPFRDGSCMKLGTFPRPAQLNSLPLLHAVVIETLRLRDRGPFPRLSPPSEVSIAGSAPLPSNVRVSVYSYVLHHSSEVFPSPNEWDPNRWLKAEIKSSAPEKCGEIGKHFHAFGGGDRTCVGRDLAMYEMKAVLATIYSTYETWLADGEAAAYHIPYKLGAGRNKVNVAFKRVG